MSFTKKSCRPPVVSFVRYRLGLSQQQLADALGISRSIIAMVETRKRKFPKSVADIYRDMCRSAEAINPGGVISVKRGRRRTGQSLPTVKINKSSTVTKNEPVADWLQQRKDLVRYQHTALQFKKRAAEERHRKLSVKLIVVNGMLNASKELMDKLPEGNRRDKYELRAAVLFAKQVRLKQQLKKCGVLAQMQTEYQTNMLEGQITMTEEKIVAMNKEPEPSINTITSGTANCQHENFFSEKEKEDRQHCGVAAVAV